MTWPSGFCTIPQLSFRSLALLRECYDGEGRILVLRIPRRCGSKHEISVNPGSAALLADYLTSLAGCLPLLTKPQADALAEPTRQIVEACFASHFNPAKRADAAYSRRLLERARHVVQQNINSPGFGPLQLVSALATSRSKLYRIMQSCGGVTAFIQHERLQQARRLLGDPAERRTISLIAAEVGFSDHSTFSRAFRSKFGISPSQARSRVDLQHNGTAGAPSKAAAAGCRRDRK